MRLLCLSFLVATGCSSAQEGGACTVIGCQPQATLDVPIAAGASDLLEIQACRNTVCGTTTVQLSTGGGGSVTYPTTGPKSDLLYVAGSGKATISILGQNTDLKEGDVYHVTVVDQTTKATLADVTTQPATYAKVQPNGAACDGEFHCQQAKLVAR